MRLIAIVSFILVCFSSLAASQNIPIKILALFTNKALIQVGDQQKILKAGESFESIQLISANGRYAEVLINGSVRKMTISQTIQSQFKEPDLQSTRIYPDAQGMYTTAGFINKNPVEFIVDTGATYVSLSSLVADRLNINYLNGIKGRSHTAAGIVSTWNIILDSVSVGEINMRRVKAAVIESELELVLLGNSFLEKIQILRTGSVLVLKEKY